MDSLSTILILFPAALFYPEHMGTHADTHIDMLGRHVFLEQSKTYGKIEGKVKRFPIYPLHSHMHSLPS